MMARRTGTSINRQGAAPIVSLDGEQMPPFPISWRLLASANQCSRGDAPSPLVPLVGGAIAYEKTS